MESPENSQGHRSELISPLPLSELFLWGRVARPIGLQGDLLAECFSESPRAYDTAVFWVAFPGHSVALPKRVTLLRPYKSVKQRASSPSKTLWRLRWEGVCDRTAAEAFFRAELYLPRSYLPPLPAGSFYYVEAVGATVVDEQGIVRGRVSCIVPGPAYDFFIVVGESGEEFWVPAPFVGALDREKGVLLVKAPEGIWDPSLAQGLP